MPGVQSSIGPTQTMSYPSDCMPEVQSSSRLDFEPLDLGRERLLELQPIASCFSKLSPPRSLRGLVYGVSPYQDSRRPAADAGLRRPGPGPPAHRDVTLESSDFCQASPDIPYPTIKRESPPRNALRKPLKNPL